MSDRDPSPVPQAAVCAQMRRLILEQAWRAGVGHIGSALSVADVVGTLYEQVLRGRDAADPERDRFVLSNGHAALALYVALHLRGWLSRERLQTYCEDGSLLGVHPQHNLDGVDFSTGSLGQGLSVGAGFALGARLQGSARRVFVVMSDAECNEGSVWEAAMFAAHHGLANLTAVIDRNGQQALGQTRKILDLAGLGDAWRALGWQVVDVDGHDIEALARALKGPASGPEGTGRPRLLIAHTVFGKGVSFMQSQVKWHYSPLSDAEYEAALAELGGEPSAAHSWAR